MTVLRTVLGLLRLAAGAVRRALAPVLGVVSPLGWIVLAAALVSGLAASLLGWSEFAYLSLTMGSALAIAAFFLIGRARFRVVIELSPRRVTAGQRAFGRLLVSNGGSSRSTATRLELPVGRGEAEFGIPPLPVGGEQEELFAVPTARRAVIVAGPAISVRGDQLGLLRRRVRWAEPVELFVHPVTTLLAPSRSGLVRDLEGHVTSTLTDSDLAFHALRPYEAGDDQRYVHWRTSARTGQLMVRQFQETRRSELMLVQLLGESDYADAAEFELAVSMMASIGTQVIREKTRIRVVTEARELRTATVTTLLDDSCRLETLSGVRRSLRELLRATLTRGVPPSVLVVVTGSGTPVNELRAIEAVVGPDTQLLGIRAEPGAASRVSRRSSTSTSGGSRVRLVTVGELADLPKLLRRTS